MENVKAMLERGIFLSGDLDEIFHQRVLRYGKRLRYDNVVSLGEEGKGKLHEVETSWFVNFINTKEVDDDRISRFIWDLRQLSNFNISHEGFIFSIVKILNSFFPSHSFLDLAIFQLLDLSL